MSVKVKEIKDKNIWEEYLLLKNPQSFLQSWNWGEVNREIGNKTLRFAFYKSNKICGAAQFICQDAKRGKHIIIPGGPIIDWTDNGTVKTFIHLAEQIAEAEKAIFVRLRPEIKSNQGNIKLFNKFGFVPSPMHLHAENTWILDLGVSEEELLKNMRKTTRYLIKKSSYCGFELLRTIDKKYIDDLYQLQDETARRNKFIGFSKELFEKELEIFSKDDQSELFICKKKGEIYSAALIVFYGESAFYHFSGSSDKSRNSPASYFLQWEIIKNAKQRGCKKYNFWGISPTDNPKHRFYGVTLFKKGFGGERVDWIHAHDIIISPFYYFTNLFEKLRKYFRNL